MRLQARAHEGARVARDQLTIQLTAPQAAPPPQPGRFEVGGGFGYSSDLAVVGSPTVNGLAEASLPGRWSHFFAGLWTSLGRSQESSSAAFGAQIERQAMLNPWLLLIGAQVELGQRWSIQGGVGGGVLASATSVEVTVRGRTAVPKTTQWAATGLAGLWGRVAARLGPGQVYLAVPALLGLGTPTGWERPPHHVQALVGYGAEWAWP
jgi:hypothetical protein